MKDAEVWKRLSQGDVEVLVMLYQEKGDYCFKFAKRYSRQYSGQACTDEQAWNLVKGAWEIVRDKAIEGKKLTARIEVVACGVIKNKWRDYVRKRRRGDFAEGGQELPLHLAESHEPQAAQLRNLVRHVLERTPERCRKMLTYRYFNRYSFEKIAGLMGYAQGDVVRAILPTCKRRFAVDLQRAGERQDWSEMPVSDAFHDFLDDLVDRLSVADPEHKASDEDPLIATTDDLAKGDAPPNPN